MQIVQWIVAAGTAAFVALVGYFQWRTAQQKAALDLFERRHEIYVTIRESVRQILTDSPRFDQQQQMEFLRAMERAYFFFGNDVGEYLEKFWLAIVDVRAADTALSSNQASAAEIERRGKAYEFVAEFYKVGQPLFGRYMRLEQTVGVSVIALARRYISRR